jgi:hypothetical protein
MTRNKSRLSINVPENSLKTQRHVFDARVIHRPFNYKILKGIAGFPVVHYLSIPNLCLNMTEVTQETKREMHSNNVPDHLGGHFFLSVHCVFAKWSANPRFRNHRRATIFKTGFAGDCCHCQMDCQARVKCLICVGNFCALYR